MRFRLLLTVALPLFLTACIQAQSKPAPKAEGETEYLAVFMGGNKIGHAVTTRKVQDGKVVTSTDMMFSINRMGVALELKVSRSATETVDGKPLALWTEQNLGGMVSSIEGAIDADGKLKLVTASAGSTSERTVDWPQGALLDEGARLHQLRMGLKKGTRYTLKVFEASMLKGQDVTVEVGGKTKTDLLGRVVELTEVKTILGMPPMGDVTTLTYVNDDLKALKSVSPMLGMNLEIVSCPKEVALSQVQPMDFFDKVILRSPQPLKGLSAAKAATYHIVPEGKAELRIPDTDNQKVTRNADGSLVVTVRPAQPAAGAEMPYKGNDAKALSALKPSRYIESDHKEVLDLAKKAVGDAKDPIQAVRKIQAFVRDYIKEKNLSVGYASAAEVVEGKEGDCTEHAVLAAALCRAVGIPAQVVCGVAYVEKYEKHQDIFGPHAWAQAYVGGQWIGLDSAFPHGFDVGHISLAAGNGDPDDFFGIVKVLGYFKIVKVDVER